MSKHHIVLLTLDEAENLNSLTCQDHSQELVSWSRARNWDEYDHDEKAQDVKMIALCSVCRGGGLGLG
jgi:hypothetical protein